MAFLKTKFIFLLATFTISLGFERTMDNLNAADKNSYPVGNLSVNLSTELNNFLGKFVSTENLVNRHLSTELTDFFTSFSSAENVVNRNRMVDLYLKRILPKKIQAYIAFPDFNYDLSSFCTLRVFSGKFG